jgi:outer membrane protein OmpA-like peptidoglycan-associated protein
MASLVILAGLAAGLVSSGAQSQVIDRTQGAVTRCDLYRSLGRAYPPECGGSGHPLPPTTRGRLNLGGASAPAAAPPPAQAHPPVPSATAAPAQPTATAPTAPPAIGVGLPILFALDSDVLTPSAIELIDELADVFKYNSAQKYIIEGHTDVTGESTHNAALSIKRAQAVVRHLVQKHGLAEDRFIVRGLGSAQLLLPADGKNERNRRVQVLRVDS